MATALSPARVNSVEIVDPVLRAARVIVPDYQLSLAIGKEGQNARLAAKLTGWRIDIRPDTAARRPRPRAARVPEPAPAVLTGTPRARTGGVPAGRRAGPGAPLAPADRSRR